MNFQNADVPMYFTPEEIRESVLDYLYGAEPYEAPTVPILAIMDFYGIPPLPHPTPWGHEMTSPASDAIVGAVIHTLAQEGLIQLVPEPNPDRLDPECARRCRAAIPTPPDGPLYCWIARPEWQQ